MNIHSKYVHYILILQGKVKKKMVIYIIYNLNL